MPAPRPRSAPDSLMAKFARRSQADFESEFFTHLLDRLPDYAEVLQAQSDNLLALGRVEEAAAMEERLAVLRPKDATVHYHLACRYARLQQRDRALHILRRAVELGYRDVRTMNRDKDLESIRKDPRFRAMLRELTGQ